MKIVINRCYGGFSITYACAKKLGIDKYDASDYRTDERLIKMVEENADEVSGHFSKLSVVEIPDNKTDYEVNEYDGYESITYVVDGLLHHI